MTDPVPTYVVLSDPDQPSFLADLLRGRLRWDLIEQFPEPDPDDLAAGDAEVKRIGELVTRLVDPVAVDRDRALPDGLVEELRAAGYFGMVVPTALGGLELSRRNMFRVIETAARVSPAVGLTLSIENTIGVPAFLPLIPAGPLRDTAEAYLRQDRLSCLADTEPIGANNKRRLTTATPTKDGSGYLINGEKLFVGNGSLADFMCTTATEVINGLAQTRLFFVDGRQPGVRLHAAHEFMGLKGFPNGNIVFTDAFVPADHVLTERYNERLTPSVVRALTLGRIFSVVAPSLAIGKECVLAAREYVSRRQMNDVPLGRFEQIQRLLASSLADVFAVETLAEWVLLGDEHGVNTSFEQSAAKNFASGVAWRLAGRTVGLLAGEGYETARSKIARGAHPGRAEQLLRDVRGMLVTGGVDFNLDIWMSEHLIFPPYYTEPAPVLAAAPRPALANNRWPRHQEHLDNLAAQTHAFAQTCAALARQYPERAELFARQRIHVLLSRIANELFVSALTLARAARLAEQGDPDAAGLADIFCVESRRRVVNAQHELAEVRAGRDSHELSEVATGWLSGDLVQRWAR